MVDKKILFVFIIFIVNVLYVNAENKMEYDKYLESQMFIETENGFVSTKALAIKLAEIYLIDISVFVYFSFSLFFNKRGCRDYFFRFGRKDNFGCCKRDRSDIV